jgi:hypothetical protein
MAGTVPPIVRSSGPVPGPTRLPKPSRPPPPRLDPGRLGLGSRPAARTGPVAPAPAAQGCVAVPRSDATAEASRRGVQLGRVPGRERRHRRRRGQHRHLGRGKHPSVPGCVQRHRSPSRFSHASPGRSGRATDVPVGGVETSPDRVLWRWLCGATRVGALAPPPPARRARCSGRQTGPLRTWPTWSPLSAEADADSERTQGRTRVHNHRGIGDCAEPGDNAPAREASSAHDTLL